MPKSLFLFLILLSLPLVSAHDYQSADGKTVAMEIIPNEPPIAGETSIFDFTTTSDDGSEITHIDGNLSIEKNGELFLNSRSMHSHGDEYSTSYKFPEAGNYTVELTVQPSDHYEGTQFDPIEVEFSVEVIEGGDVQGSSSVLFWIEGAVIVVLLLGLAVVIRKKKGMGNKSL